MSWRIEHSEPERFLRVTAAGPVFTDDAFEQVRLGVERIVRDQLPGALVDYSAAVLEMPIVDIFKMPDMFDALQLPHRTKIAILLPSDPVNMHKYTFFDNTANNRGFQVRLFWEPSAALGWLAEAIPRQGSA